MQSVAEEVRRAPMEPRVAARWLGRMGIDANRVGTRLWIGSRPAPGPGLAAAGFQELILCAEEYQPSASEFPGLRAVVHAGIDDHEPTNEEIRIATRAARRAAQGVRQGSRVLVTCQAGLNRSGLVTALAVHELTGWSGKRCGDLVRSERPGALSNQHFRALLDALPAR